MTSRLTLTLAALTLVLCACREEGEVHHFRVKKSTPPSATPPIPSAPTATPSSNKHYTWTLPDGWTAKPASGMRLATLVIPTPGTTLQASITEFGGTTASNINRWRTQIGLPPLAESEIPATLQQIDTGLGKGHIAMLINPATPEKAMLAAIIPRPSGTSVFIKVTGSISELKTIAAPFRQFVISLASHE